GRSRRVRRGGSAGRSARSEAPRELLSVERLHGSTRASGAETSEGGLGLQARDEGVGVTFELRALGARDGVAGDELLTERVDASAGLDHLVVEMRPGAQPGRERVAALAPRLEPDAGDDATVAHVLRDEDPAVVHEAIARVALLDQETEAVPGPGVGGEIEVPLEDVDQRHHELRRLAHVVDRLEERALHLAVYRRDAHVGLGLATRDRPAPVLAPSREAHPGARRVAHLNRLAAEVPGDVERVAGPELLELRTVLREEGRELGGHARTDARAHERANEVVAGPDLDGSGGGPGRREDLERRGRRQEPRPWRVRPEVETRGGAERAEARRQERRCDGGTIRHWPIIAGARAPRTQESSGFPPAGPDRPQWLWPS